MNFFFVSDLHGSIDRYNKLFNEIRLKKPDAVFFGGDLFPSGLLSMTSSSSVLTSFIHEVLEAGMKKLKSELKNQYPKVFIILGNDDSKLDELDLIDGENFGLWEYIHNKKSKVGEYIVYGYSFIPPSPFLMKDFEKYDVSRYVDPGCIPPEEGAHSYPVNKSLIQKATIKEDLAQLVKEEKFDKTIFLFHSPPYRTKLDRANLDGKLFDHVPLDVNIGSIAIQRFIESKQPSITLHGHVHESARLTGDWMDKIDETIMFSAAHDGRELALVSFDPANPESATRTLI